MTDSQKSDETLATAAANETEAEATPAENAGAAVDNAGETAATAAPAAADETAEAAEPATPTEAAEPAAPAAADEPAEAAESAAAPSAETPAEPAAEPVAEAEATAAPAPAPSPAARPAPSPAAFAARPKAKPSPAAPAPAPVAVSSAASLAEAARWGRVEGDGHVFLTVDGTEYPVGQYPGVSADEALGYFARKFDDVVAQIVLLEQRVSSKAPTADMQKTVTHLREQLAERNMVGDFRSAEARLDALVTQIGELEKAEKAEHDAVRAAELAAREAIVAEAEEIAGHDPAQIQWKTSSARMNELFESWKTA